MESSVINATPSPAEDEISRRRSGRVSRAPAHYTPDPFASSKRKRGADHDGADAEDELQSSDEDGDEDGEDEGEDDDDQGKASEWARPSQKPKRKTSAQPSRPKRPAAKKPKTNGHATGLPSRPKQVAPLLVEGIGGDGLFGTHPRSCFAWVSR